MRKRKQQIRTVIKLKRPTTKRVLPVEKMKKPKGAHLFKPGQPSPNPSGRPKGTLNKFTTLKKAFLEAFELLGGVQGLVDFANQCWEHKKAFYQMTAKMLPRDIYVGDGGIEPNDLSTLKEEELDAIIIRNFKGQ